ncbi:unnamed protein product [Aphis gossypii]|uniref:Uncharacterized protein n=1 Tax=Aphis gossypii TaxID=80765 RepID=A0A9P0NFU7_APHGO|nr:unnamed protein product [Aphis gossypii]
MRITLYRRVCYNSYSYIYIYILHYTLQIGRRCPARRAEENAILFFSLASTHSLRFISAPTIITSSSSSSSSHNRSPAFAIHRRWVLNFFIFFSHSFPRTTFDAFFAPHAADGSSKLVTTPPPPPPCSIPTDFIDAPADIRFRSLLNHKLLTHVHIAYIRLL